MASKLCLKAQLVIFFEKIRVFNGLYTSYEPVFKISCIVFLHKNGA